jgi:hypothetical protein
MDMTEDERRAEIDGATLRYPSPGERLLAMSEKFLGTPYLISPLGEGAGRDPDPLIRFDAVDCLTFVEETMALTLAASSQEVEPLLSRIRYSTQPRYEDRNHLMEAQWIPNNVRKGFLAPATRRYAGAGAVELSKHLDDRTWESKSSRQLSLPKESRPVGDFPVLVAPLDRALAIAAHVDPGTILLVVREDRPFRVTRVSHAGFVVQRGGRTYLRHATKTSGKVVDEDLKAFLLRNSKYERWRVVGVSLFEVAAPSKARVQSPDRALP